MPKFAGNIWNMSACNRLVAERIEGRRHEKHIRALEQTRGMVDSAHPAEFAHLRSKAKTRQLQEDRAAAIQLENRILLQKMLNIDMKPSQVVSETMAAPTFKPRSLTADSRRHELDAIAKSNQELLKRLQTAKPSIDRVAWEDEEIDRQALKFRMSQNACRGRLPRLRMPEKSQMSSRLPKIGGGRSHSAEDDWAELSSIELDGRLRELEHGANLSPGTA